MLINTRAISSLFSFFFGWLKLVIWLNQNSKWLKKIVFWGGFLVATFQQFFLGMFFSIWVLAYCQKCEGFLDFLIFFTFISCS